jgi:alpha-L-fucosidase 2
MNIAFKRISFLLLSLLFVSNISWSQNKIQDKTDWRAFLSAHDMVFDKMPSKWEEAPFFANGFIGSMVYADTLAGNKIKIQVFRTDVQDHRGDTSGWTPYSRPRLLIGYFLITLKGKIISSHMRQHLYTADLTGDVRTSEGSISLHHYVSAENDLIFTEITTGGNEKYTLNWQPAEAKSTRKIFFPTTETVIPLYANAYGEKYKQILKVYQPNPQPELKKIKDISISIQNLLAGGQHVVAWKEDSISVNKSIVVMTVKQSYPGKSAQIEAVNLIAETNKDAFDKSYKQHTIWWSAFYKRSFVSIPDKKLEGFYWLQIYKLGCANGANGPIMDTSGPWFQDTPWPYITWDLNVQLCYWALNTSNHLDIARSLPNSLNKYQQNLINNVKPVEWRKNAAYLALATAQDLIGSADDDKRYENLHANLPWVMHNVWLMYRYSMDKDFLRTRCYPLLKRSINYYLHIITKEQDGKYHIPLGYSPEYPAINKGKAGETKDANIDIALLKWGLQALMESSEILHTDAEERNHWKNILNNLTNFQTDENGFKIGDDMPYTVSHRHYSHLLMIYPLYLVNTEQGNNKELIERSLIHWVGNPKGLQGYSYTGASSISAAMGNGDQALDYLKGLDKFLLPNGLYKESGPCFETPLSGAQAIQDMLLQSWGNKIRIFPAVPGEWKDIVFHKWLAEGAFEVSARLTKGKTDFIMIKSLAGSPCTFTTTIKNPTGFIGKSKVELKLVSKSTYNINLKRGQIVLVTAKGFSGSLIINAVN